MNKKVLVLISLLTLVVVIAFGVRAVINNNNERKREELSMDSNTQVDRRLDSWTNKEIVEMASFVGNRSYNTHGVTIEQLTQIVSNGDLKQGKRPLDEKEFGYSAEQQQEIWDVFHKYVWDHRHDISYHLSLLDARKTHREEIEARFGDKYDLEVEVFGRSPVGMLQWPTEVLIFVIELMGSLPDTVD